MDGTSSERDARGERVRVRVNSRQRRDRNVRRSVGYSLAGLVLIAGGGAAASSVIATPRAVESGVSCHQSMDVSGPLHQVGFVDGQSLPEDPSTRITAAIELCALQGGSTERASNAVCVRPDGLIAVFPKARTQEEIDLCREVGYEAAGH